MPQAAEADPAAPPPVTDEDARAHLVGEVRGQARGPLLVVVGGMHGNEPAGIEASRRVLDELQRRPPAELRGDLVALQGNRQAMAHGVRYLATDLNRAFTAERIARLERGELDPQVPEDREQAELMRLLDLVLAPAAAATPPRRVIFLDLHTASAKSVPFILIGDNLPNITFAAHFPLPTVLGLEEAIDGALLEHFNALGHMTMGVEGGQHDDPAAVDACTAVLWIALVAAGMVSEDYVPDYAAQQALLAEAAGDLPRFIEVRHRHPVAPGDRFAMKPGYINFQRIRAGELLATDKDGEIHAPWNGMMLLPLYQGHGSDGFFLAREFKPFWQRVSGLLRRTGVSALLPWLPGVRRAPAELAPGGSEAYIVDTRVARWYPREIFHLLGFRKLRELPGQLLVGRRRQLQD